MFFRELNNFENSGLRRNPSNSAVKNKLAEIKERYVIILFEKWFEAGVELN